ncbi:mycofactocin biosynthesis peptidyl-dipeptidase MftE [Rhodococcus sp. X156]|uniref:mycofactocin biosynthesis peptidyl-dipeptidase MftE n=1 Tax=Rhodococcus sp. X156 TaxID=2499145 RepID=UPI000FDCB2A3|nr:mycofactocin biosynthesis peptidyl-dipeptidase MftE [Rhodococcus sp. X156]
MTGPTCFSTAGDLAGLTWPEVPADALLVVPVGSVEQHGPHLPLDTDARVASAVARELVRTTAGAVLAPAVPYGASGEHESFPGTISIGTEALRTLLVELGRSACRWAPRLVLVNGHGGNAQALVQAVRLLRQESRDVAWLPCAVPASAAHVPDAHAGRTETSLLLALHPADVRTAVAAAGATAPVATLMPALRAGGVRAVSANGVLGDPAGAHTAEGEQLLAALAEQAAGAVRRWAPDTNGMLS